MVISKDKMVSIHYDLIDEKGVTIDSSREFEPMDFVQGSGYVVEGLEEVLEGKKKGDSFSTVISPEKGYGLRDENLVYVVPKADFGENTNKLVVGQQIQINSEEGSFVVTVSAMTKESVTLDGNHPLAGMPLNFKIDIVDVREATEEEIDEFYNGCGCGDDCDCDEDDDCCGGEHHHDDGHKCSCH